MAAAAAGASSAPVASLDGVILRALEHADIADSRCWADEQGVSHDDVEREMNSLESEGYITKTLNQTLFWELTPAGDEAVALGSPELVILKALPAEEALAQADVKAKVGDDVFKGGLGIAKKNGWVEIEKGTGNVVRKVSLARVVVPTLGEMVLARPTSTPCCARAFCVVSWRYLLSACDAPRSCFGLASVVALSAG